MLKLDANFPMTKSLKQTTTSGLLWSSIERFSVQGVQFFIMLIMARLLMPSDYGIIGMLSIFLAISQAIIDSGFSQALIRKQDRTEVDNSTVFYFNIVVSGLLYLILFILAPFVGEFYNTPILCPIMRVVCLTLIINSLAVVQRALLTVKIDFKTQAKASLISAILSGITGITFAYWGYGVWAIVYSSLVSSTVNSLLLWLFAHWRPIWAYSWVSFKELFSFGSRLLGVSIIDTIYNNIYTIVIGKVFTAGDLGHYTRAQNFAQLPSSNITGILQRVTYPVLCQIQNEDERLAVVYRKFLKLSAFIVFPLMCGLAGLSTPLVVTVIGEKWLFCSKLLTIICFGMMWYPIHAINLNLLEVKGRTDLFLKIEYVKKGIGVILLAISIPFGVEAMCIAGIGLSLCALVINTYYTGKMIQIGFFKQMQDLAPILGLSLLMFTVLYCLHYFIVNNLIQLFIGIPLGIAIYLIPCYLFNLSELDEIFKLLHIRK